MAAIGSRIRNRLTSFSNTVFDSLSVISSYDLTPKFWYFFIIAFFFVLVLLPTTYVIIFLMDQFPSTVVYLTSNPEVISQIQEAIINSTLVSIIVSIIDLLFGIPLAWLVVRGKFRYKNFLNTLIELPLAVPTAGLGLSVAMFWGVTPSIQDTPFSLGFIKDIIPILVLFHFTTTFPYVVRSLAAILEEIDVTLEIAAQTCGASKLTAARTITLPLFRSGVATALVLSIAKSLSDTGGIVAVLTAIGSSALTGTRLIDIWKKGYDENPALEPALALLSVVMIIVAIILMSISRLLAKKIKMPTRKVWPSIERSL
ncbi:MAG: ABC transporter permease subunit, partial [Candidatus Heimdallarchaeota archaeon]